MALNNSKSHWRINNEIRAREVRVVSADGKQIGVMSLADALRASQEAGVDLVEIAPMAVPPVTKIIEFGKFRYIEEKKAKKEKRGSKASELKEIRFSPFIGQADYETRTARIKEFLEERNKVRAVVVFKGRQLGSKQFGYDLLKRILADFDGKVSVDMEPKFVGRHLAMIISPLSKAKQVKEQNGES